MNIALLLHHGVRPDAPSEVMSRPHVELLASTTVERDRLRVLAEQIKAFGSIPFSFKEMDSIDQTRHGAILRIALCQQDEESAPGPSGPAGGGR